MATTKTKHSMTKLLSKVPVLRGWLGRRAVARKLKKLENRYSQLIEEARKDGNRAKVHSLESDLMTERDLILGPVYAGATQKLVTKARRFGIIVPPISEESDDWVEFGPEGYWILNTDAQIRLRKEVREEQWAHNDERRKWATLMLAILGFTLGFWSLIVKSKQPDPCPRNYYRNDAGACVFALSPQGQPSQSLSNPPKPSQTPAVP
jgi:hypothetical protein